MPPSVIVGIFIDDHELTQYDIADTSVCYNITPNFW
jgi:hypothetical protein